MLTAAKHNLAEDQLGDLLAESSSIDYQQINKWSAYFLQPISSV